MSELFDYVDRDDNVIGQTTFDDARAQNRIIRVVHNWIINSEGKILFQFRAAHKTSMPRRFDASCGGRVDAGETYHEAVVRETREELGIETAPQHIGKVFVDSPKEYKFISVYYSRHNGPFSGWEAEAEAIEWMSFDEAKNLYNRFPYLFCGVQSMECLFNYLKGQ